MTPAEDRSPSYQLASATAARRKQRRHGRAALPQRNEMLYSRDPDYAPAGYPGTRNAQPDGASPITGFINDPAVLHRTGCRRVFAWQANRLAYNPYTTHFLRIRRV